MKRTLLSIFIRKPKKCGFIICLVKNTVLIAAQQIAGFPQNQLKKSINIKFQISSASSAVFSDKKPNPSALGPVCVPIV